MLHYAADPPHVSWKVYKRRSRLLDNQGMNDAWVLSRTLTHLSEPVLAGRLIDKLSSLEKWRDVYTHYCPRRQRLDGGAVNFLRAREKLQCQSGCRCLPVSFHTHSLMKFWVSRRVLKKKCHDAKSMAFLVWSQLFWTPIEEIRLDVAFARYTILGLHIPRNSFHPYRPCITIP